MTCWHSLDVRYPAFQIVAYSNIRPAPQLRDVVHPMVRMTPNTCSNLFDNSRDMPKHSEPSRPTLRPSSGKGFRSFLVPHPHSNTEESPVLDG